MKLEWNDVTWFSASTYFFFISIFGIEWRKRMSKKWEASKKGRKIGYCYKNAGVKQIEVMNINSQKPIAFFLSILSTSLHSSAVTVLAFISCCMAMKAAQHEPLALSRFATFQFWVKKVDIVLLYLTMRFYCFKKTNAKQTHHRPSCVVAGIAETSRARKTCFCSG